MTEMIRCVLQRAAHAVTRGAQARSVSTSSAAKAIAQARGMAARRSQAAATCQRGLPRECGSCAVRGALAEARSMVAAKKINFVFWKNYAAFLFGCYASCKIMTRVAPYNRSSSAFCLRMPSGGPLPGALWRAAPGERKVPFETRAKRGKVAPIPVSEEPLLGGVGRAAPGELKVPAKSRAKRGKVAPIPASEEHLPGRVGRAAPGELKVPAESRAKRGKVAPIPTSQEPLPGAAGKMASGEPKAQSQSRAASVDRLPPLVRKAAEAKFKAETEASKTRMAMEAAVLKAMKSPCLAHGLCASTTPAPSTCRSPSPPPYAHSDFLFKIMMAGGAAVAFITDLLKGYVDKQVDLKMIEKDAEEKVMLIKEKEKELELKKQELEIVTKEQKRRGWFW